MIKQLKKNLKKHLKPIIFFQTQNVNKVMIILDTQHLKIVEEEEEDLEILTFQVLFQIFLKIFLEKDLVEEDALENQIIEVQT